MRKEKESCRRIFLLALALLVSAAQGRAADGWIVGSARTGDMAFGSTTAGVPKLGGALLHRTPRLVVRTDPTTGRRVRVRTFTGGVFTTRMTWAQFVAMERGR